MRYRSSSLFRSRSRFASSPAHASAAVPGRRAVAVADDRAADELAAAADGTFSSDRSCSTRSDELFAIDPAPDGARPAGRGSPDLGVRGESGSESTGRTRAWRDADDAASRCQVVDLIAAQSAVALARAGTAGQWTAGSVTIAGARCCVDLVER